MSFATTYINKEGEDWSRAVATSHFYNNEDNTITLGYEGYLQNEDKEAEEEIPGEVILLKSSVMKELKNNAEINETFIDYYCEKCNYNERCIDIYSELFTSGNEIINTQHAEDMEQGKFLTCGCDNCE